MRERCIPSPLRHVMSSFAFSKTRFAFANDIGMIYPRRILAGVNEWNSARFSDFWRR